MTAARATFAESAGMTIEMRDEMIARILSRLIVSGDKVEDAYLRRELQGATKRIHSAALSTGTTGDDQHAALMTKCNIRSRAMGFIR